MAANKIRKGDTVVEVSTDKVDAEVPAPVDGVITKLLVAVDDEVPVGAPMAEMEPGEGSSEGRSGQAAGPVAGDDASSSQAAGEAPSPTPPAADAAAANGGDSKAGSGNGGADVRATPVADARRSRCGRSR